MLTREDISQVERIENQHHMRIHAAFRSRDQSKDGLENWKKAALAWHAQRYPTDFLWSDEFITDLRNSKRDAIEQAILYLEVDPWYFRSGYLKERLVRRLKSANLSTQDCTRLRNVIWNVASGKNRREFRDFCRLATVVASDDFRQRLVEVSSEHDTEAKGKFTFLRKHLDRHTTKTEQDSSPNAR